METGIGPVEAIRGALAKAGLKIDDIDVSHSIYTAFEEGTDANLLCQLFDVNEAFAAQWLSVARELQLPNDKSNVFGGAIGESLHSPESSR